jgi:hypothetical protein
MEKGRLWHFFHPRGYTRKLTPYEAEMARADSKSDSAFLSVECHKCEGMVNVRWLDLRNLAAMSPPQRHHFIMSDMTTYPCSGCGRRFLVTWDGNNITIMQPR